jgi:hypothetical protein
MPVNFSVSLRDESEPRGMDLFRAYAELAQFLRRNIFLGRDVSRVLLLLMELFAPGRAPATSPLHQVLHTGVIVQ